MRSARGGWIGLTASHTRADLIRALLEGVSFSLRDCLEIIQQMGIAVESVTLSGGGAKSAFWRQMLANVFDKPAVILDSQEGSAYGAALLAMAGGGEFGSVAEVCEMAIKEKERVEPVSQAYDKRYRIFQGLYGKLAPFYREVAALS